MVCVTLRVALQIDRESRIATDTRLCTRRGYDGPSQHRSAVECVKVHIDRERLTCAEREQRTQMTVTRGYRTT
jgi:hypothetical protein